MPVRRRSPVRWRMPLWSTCLSISERPALPWRREDSMRLRTLELSLLGTGILSGLLGGCVYYNGMYNANRLARSARQAERDGRTLEASSLWGQVATKAESVVVRHPTSKYAEQASLLQGIALAKLGQCAQALAPLSRPAATS